MKNLLAIMLLGFVGCGIDNGLHDPDEMDLPPHYAEALENPEQEDIYLEPSPQPVDILFVIDKSCSMIDDAAAIGENIPAFIDYINEQNIDFHIGVISTSNYEPDGAGILVAVEADSDEENPDLGIDTDIDTDSETDTGTGTAELINFITPQTLNPATVFSNMNVKASIQGQSEAGIDAVSFAMGSRLEEGENQDFFRYGVPLQIVTITDEEDQSEFYTPLEFVNNMFHWMAEHNNTIYYSAILTMPESVETCDYYIYPPTIGYRYMKVTEKVNGLAIDICQNDWSVALEAIAEYATPVPKSEYILKGHPLLDATHTLRVLVERGPVTLSFENVGDWTYDENRNSVWIKTTTNGEAYEHQLGDITKISYTVNMY